MRLAIGVLMMLFLGCVQFALAEPEVRQAGPERKAKHQRLTEDERVQRRARMREMREMLIERQAREQVETALPEVRQSAVPAVREPVGGPGRGRREGLRHLDPEERQRLRQAMREAAREVYRRQDEPLR